MHLLFFTSNSWRSYEDMRPTCNLFLALIGNSTHKENFFLLNLKILHNLFLLQQMYKVYLVFNENKKLPKKEKILFQLVL